MPCFTPGRSEIGRTNPPPATENGTGSTQTTANIGPQLPSMEDTGASAGEARRQRFVQQLPKIELHAHLNGSIRRSTLRELAASKKVDPSGALILTRWPKTLSEAFDVFRTIHACVTTLADVERLAYELGHDLEDDGVVYAEIRTTPRAMTCDSAEDGAWEEGLEEYVQAVLRGFSRYTASASESAVGGSKKVILRLLLSIDRAKHSTSHARAIVDLAQRYRQRGVVGIDLSGDPTRGEWSQWQPVLQHAREVGLKVTLHAGEVRDRDAEMASMLDFHPDRFGHCCFVSDPNLARLKYSRIPIELCLTSNLLSNSVAELKQHHFGIHYTHVDSHNHTASSVDGVDGESSTICCISTDDSGVFGSALSNEYRLVMDTFALGEHQAFHLARRTLDATFLSRGQEQDEQDRQCILERFERFHKSWDW